jgi:4-hydroxy-2-oxoheptanedioate aldolase
MQQNRVKRILQQGGTAIGTFAGCFSSAEMVEVVGHAGFDGIFIDMEHMPFDLREVQRMVMAAEHVGITPMVRTPGFDPALILRLLDLGAQGIHVPHVTTAAMARAAVKATYYPPLGDRGILNSSRAANYGKVPLMQHVEQSNREILLTVLIEDAEALEEIDAIAATEGVDVVGAGPADLARSFGVLGQPDHPRLVGAIERIADAVRKSHRARFSLPLGHVLYPRTAAEFIKLGGGLALSGPSPEVRLLTSLSHDAAELRRVIG